jgi:hypothetical protein
MMPCLHQLHDEMVRDNTLKFDLQDSVVVPKCNEPIATLEAMNIPVPSSKIAGSSN